MTPPTPQTIFDLSQSCAREVYGNRPAVSEYALRVAHLLFGTAAHESGGFEYTRQMGYDFNRTSGAWGLWQCESDTIRACLHRLDFRVALRTNAARWLFGNDEAPVDWYLPYVHAGPTLWLALLRQTCLSAPLSVLWARLTYFADPEPIPATPELLAAYWGRVYNTRNEAGKNEQWLEAYRRYLPSDAPALEE